MSNKSKIYLLKVADPLKVLKKSKDFMRNSTPDLNSDQPLGNFLYSKRFLRDLVLDLKNDQPPGFYFAFYEKAGGNITLTVGSIVFARHWKSVPHA